MRALLGPLGSFLALLLVGCGGAPAPVETAPSARAQAIINGDQCPASTAPTAVAILADATVDFAQFGGGTQDITTVLCTGTLIAPDVVITAAHCTDLTALTMGFGTVEREEFYITFEADLSALAEAGQGQGGTPPAIPASAVPVREYVRHEGFSLDSMGAVDGPGDFKDVALLFLSTTIDDVTPAVVIDPAEVEQLQVGSAVSIAGWGQQTVTSQFEAPPPGTVGIKVCGDSTINELGDSEMQVGADASTTRKCHGDSGGPTYMEVSTPHDIKARVIGITSHAYDQSDCNKGGVDTRVDAYLDWIGAQMTERCSNGTRVWCDVPGIVPASFYDEGGGEGEGEDDDDGPDRNAAGCPGCTQSSADGTALALGMIALLALRRRASSSRSPRTT